MESWVGDFMVDQEIAADRAAVCEFMLRIGRKRNKPKKADQDDKSDLDWNKYL